MELVQLVFGEGTDLSVGQMAARAALVFLLTLALIRISGRRSFGQRTSFDACTTVLLGTVLGRGIAGASPFWATLAASVVIVLMHRTIAWLAVRSVWFDRAVSGTQTVIVADGQKRRAEMLDSLISDADLGEALRKKLGVDDLSRVKTVTLERDGQMSIHEMSKTSSLS